MVESPLSIHAVAVPRTIYATGRTPRARLLSVCSELALLTHI